MSEAKTPIIDCLYILDDTTAFLAERFEQENYKLIKSREEWDKFNISEYQFNSIVILCELNWAGKYRQNFYGIEIATEMRKKHKMLCPIILNSILEESYFENKAKKNIEYNILLSPGLKFVNLLNTGIKDKVNKALKESDKYPLSKATVSDMIEMLLDLRGAILDKITHGLRYTMSEDKLEEAMQEIGAYLDKYQLNKIEWAPIKQQLKYSLGNEEIFNRNIGELTANCERELKSTEGAPKSTINKKHRIIVLEDDPHFRKKIEANLLEHFEEVFITGEVSEAIQKLDDDQDNSFQAIIADWRLYDNMNSNYWQAWQGYDVLDYAANDNSTALFSLTSINDRNVHKIRNELGLDVHLFKKQPLEAEGKHQWNMMADIIKQACDEKANE